MIKIGSKFQEARLRKGLTLDEISGSTKIRKEFLEAIEEGDYKSLPSSAYAYGFVRNYANFLEIDEKLALALFKREFDSDKAFQVLPKYASKDRSINRKKIRVGRSLLAICAVMLFVLSFIFYQYKGAIFNPSLAVSEPKEGEILYVSEIEVKGKTDANATVYVDNNLVSVSENGDFRKIISVFPGKSAIRIKSTNRFGKETEITRRINVKSGY